MQAQLGERDGVRTLLVEIDVTGGGSVGRISQHARRRAKELRRDMTGPESRLWSLLRDRRLHGLKFRRQQPIGPFIVDFFCAESMLIVELDGRSHTDRGESDLSRQTYLEQAGYNVLRIDNDDVLANDLEPVLWAILKAAGKPIPGAFPDRPSPPEGEGPIRSVRDESG